MRPRLNTFARRLLGPDFLIGAALFLFALFLRIMGINGSLPYVAHPDEPKIIDSAIHIVKSGDLNPQLYIWPSLYIYVQALLLKFHVLYGTWRGYYAGATSLPDVTHIFTLDSGVYMWARALAAAIGAAVIPVLYTVGRAMFNGSRRVGVAAALMLAVSPMHIQYSHFALTDVPMGLMGLLALWAAYRLSRTLTRGGPLLRDPLLWASALAGLLVGIATGTKYNGLYVGLVALIGLVLAWRRGGRGSTAVRVLACLVAIPLFAAFGFLLCEPYALLDWRAWYEGFAFQVHAYLPANNVDEMVDSIQNNLGGLGESEGYFFMPAFLGAVAVLLNPPVRNRAWLLIPFPVFYTLAMGRFMFVAPRNFIVTLPFLALLSGYVIDLVAMQLTTLARGYVEGVQSQRLWTVARWAIVAVAVGLIVKEPLRISYNYSRYMAEPDARNLAWTWMQQQIGQGHRFAAELHPWQVQDWPDVLAFDVENPGQQQPLTTRPPSWYAAHGYDYVVLNSNVLAENRDPAMLKLYDTLHEVAHFKGDKEGGKGATISIRVSDGTDEATPRLPAMNAFSIDVEDFARLVGFDLAPTESPDVVLDPAGDLKPEMGIFKAGQAVGLNLYYRALRDGKPTDPPWSVWIHLVDPTTGATVAQLDVQPLTAMLKQYPGITRQPHPVRDWHAGELLAGTYNFALPATLAPGTYRLETGMWVPPNGPAARTTSKPPDRIIISEIQVR